MARTKVQKRWQETHAVRGISPELSVNYKTRNEYMKLRYTYICTCVSIEHTCVYVYRYIFLHTYMKYLYVHKQIVCVHIERVCNSGLGFASGEVVDQRMLCVALVVLLVFSTFAGATCQARRPIGTRDAVAGGN